METKQAESTMEIAQNIIQENMIMSQSEPEWQKCPKCGKEYNCLCENGSCWDCNSVAVIDLDTEKNRLIKLLGGLKPYNDFTFDNFIANSEKLKCIKSVCQGFIVGRDNLYIWGDCGSGKTHLAYAIARNEKNIEIVKPPELMRSLRLIKPELEDEILSRMQKVDMLVIDELGVGRSTEFVLTVLYEIIDKRVMNYKNGLIITSNLSLEALAKKMDDDRLASRLLSICKIIHIQEPDYRLKK